MTTIGPMIATTARLSLGYAEQLIKDVTPEQFARYARIGDTVIESNHPAFIYGHLGIYSGRVIEGVGGDASGFQPDDAFVKVFSKDASCVDDPEGSIYPPMEQVVSVFTDGYRAALEAVEKADDEVFAVQNPNAASRDRFPTNGSFVTFLLGGHIMMHLGQMSAWRRAAGLGPA